LLAAALPLALEFPAALPEVVAVAVLDPVAEPAVAFCTELPRAAFAGALRGFFFAFCFGGGAL
jgi:hypothetical protein